LVSLSKKRGEKGELQIPILPKPERSTSTTNVIIKYRKEKSQIEQMLSYYEELKGKDANQVGEWSFDQMFDLMEKQ